MEVFVDFGLFEVVAAIGLSAAARRIYSHRAIGTVFLLASVLLPAIVLFSTLTEAGRWLSAAALATALVNASVVMAVIQRGPVPTLTFSQLKSGRH